MSLAQILATVEFHPIGLLTSLVFGAICAAIAASKGRSGVGWFFVGFFTGCIGLIIILCLSDLAHEDERWRRAQRDRRRLREQIRQDRMKSEVFRREVQGRLDVHDEALGLDTKGLPNRLDSAGRRLELGEPDPDDPYATDDPGPATSYSEFRERSSRDAETVAASPPPPPAPPPPRADLPDPETIEGRTWFAQLGDRPSSPLGFGELRDLYQERRIDDRSLVWTEGMADWVALDRIPGLREALS